MGASPDDAGRVAELLVRAEVGGHPGHGLRRLRQYANGWRRGTIVPSAQPEIVRDEGATLTLDGRRALGQVVCTLAADLAARRALEHGVAAVAVRHSGHAGRLADYADRACGHGAAVLLFANDSGAAQGVAPPGALEARLSTNPLAGGVPRAHAPHLVIDLSTSVVAHGKVRVLEDAGQPVPEAWVRDGLLQPLGGAKGFALASAGRGARGRRVRRRRRRRRIPARTTRGCSCWPSTPRASGSRPSWPQRLEAMLAYVLAVPLEPGADPLRAPGSTLPPLPLDPDARFDLAPALAQRLGALAGELGVAAALSSRKRLSSSS